MTSPKYKLNWLDAGKGAVTGGLASLLVFVQSTIDSGSLSFHWKQCAMSFIGGFVGYLIKNFFSSPGSKMEHTE